MITAEYGTAGTSNWRRVAIDTDAGTVTFDDCHFPNRFFSWGTDAEYTCQIADVQGVCWNTEGCGDHWRKEPVLEVVTPAGRARLPKTSAGFDAVYAALIAGMPEGTRLRWYQYPAAQSLMTVLTIFPVGIAMTILCAILLERQLISLALLAAMFIVLLPFAFLRVLSTWLGKPTLK